MKNIYLIFLIYAFCVGCDNTTYKAQIEEAQHNIEIYPQRDTLCLSKISTQTDILNLNGNMLGEVYDVLCLDDIYIVYSNAYNKMIHIYDKLGNFQKSIVSKGRANNEILNIDDICFNKYNMTIDILCDFGQYIKSYSFAGDLIKSIKLPEDTILAAAGLIATSEDTYLLYKNWGYLNIPEYKLYEYNVNTGKVKNSYIEFDRTIEEKISFSQNNNIYTSGDYTFFYEVFQNGIYKIKDNQLEKYIAFDYGKYEVPQNFFKKAVNEMDFIESCMNSNYIWGHINCIAWKNKILSLYTYHNEVYLNVADLSDNTSISYTHIYDDVFTNKVIPISEFEFISSDDSILYCNYRGRDDLEKNYIYTLK